MNTISFFAADIFIVFVTLTSLFIGWARGGTKEILSVISWVGGGYLTWSLFPYAKDITRSYISHGLIADFVTGCVLFILFLTILSVFNYFCSSFVKQSVLNKADKALGGAFGILRGLVILAIMDLIASQCMFSETPKWLENSKLRPTINTVSNFIILVLPDSVQDSILSYLPQIKKQSLFDFVKEDIVKNTKNLKDANMEDDLFDGFARNNVTASIGEKTHSNNEVANEDLAESGDDITTADKILKEDEKAPVAHPATTGQSAVDLATLKPRKQSESPENKQSESSKKAPPLKRNKKERFDMDRLLDQYDNVDEEEDSESEKTQKKDEEEN